MRALKSYMGFWGKLALFPKATNKFSSQIVKGCFLHYLSCERNFLMNCYQTKLKKISMQFCVLSINISKTI